MKFFNTIGFLIVHIIVLLIYRKYFRVYDLINDIWYINLDRSNERRDYMEQMLEQLKLPAPYQRWPGVDGSQLTTQDYNRLEIPAWSRPQFTVEARQKIRKGEIGCYLSHMSLLEHLQTLRTPRHKGHLILEDDISIDPDFFEKTEKAFRHLPGDWDILTFGITKQRNNPHVLNIRNNIGRTVWMNNNYAYLVKHSSIPKILNCVSTIREPFDTTLGRLSKMGQLNIYSYIPPLVTAREQNDTTMNGENS